MRRVWRDDHGERHWIRGNTEQEIADKIVRLYHDEEKLRALMDEIAALWGVAPNSMSQRLRRLRLELKKKLEQEGIVL